ncbi:MAG: CPXCG motif-containing cysteine-rich protein [Gammaproteobacteria bacterium]|nr:CPXCG motif-containing cysteine-rich protein [Gammaproteobacteria bacterium]
MSYQHEKTIQCPYCGEMIGILIDGSVLQQDYIEDCQVCCRPINFTVRISQDNHADVIARHENE